MRLRLRVSLSTVLAFLAALAIAFGTASGAPPQPIAKPAGPRIVVMLVVDQMWAGYVDMLKSKWTSGLHRLVDRGAWYRNAAYPYLNTVTCVGHSTISTGAFPSTHGMILNGWWDRTAGKLVACTEDAAAPLVTYGGPVVSGGESAARLLVPTFADELRAGETPRPRIVTLSLKPRSAIGLAGHGGDAVTWLDDAGAWATSTAYAEAPVPFVKDFVVANPIARDFGATWTRILPEDKYAYKDDAEGERPPRGWTTTFPHVLRGISERPDMSFVAQWQESPYSDAYLGHLAEAAIDALRLGRNETTDYLGVSFSATDAVGHGFGPRSHEVQDVLLRLDHTIGALLAHLDAAVGPDHYVVALTADHGVAPIPEQMVREGRDAGRIDAAVIAARVEQALRGVFGEGKYVASAVYTDLYFAPGVYAKLLAKPDALKSVIDVIRAMPGVQRVLRSDQLGAAGRASKDATERAASLSYFSERSGDLIIVPKPYWILSTAAGTTHGSGNEYDQRVPVILMGAGIKPGVYSQTASPVDIAPTLAAMCGIALPKADGRVLREALTAPPVGTRSDAARADR
jgi:predicted AlkP superfamily pyrophosphatase or phosphodiesterase